MGKSIIFIHHYNQYASKLFPGTKTRKEHYLDRDISFADCLNEGKKRE